MRPGAYLIIILLLAVITPYVVFTRRPPPKNHVEVLMIFLGALSFIKISLIIINNELPEIFTLFEELMSIIQEYIFGVIFIVPLFLLNNLIRE